MRGDQSEALVLRAVDFGESDRIVHLLLPDSGRTAAIARGARRSVRRFAGTLDLFHHLRVTLGLRRPGTLGRLEQATLLRTFPPLRVDPRRFALGCYLLELMDRMAPEGGARADTRRLFRFALEALDALAEGPVDARLRTLLTLRALEALGLRPELRRCVRCGRDAEGLAGRVGFHVAEGGPVCERCASEGEPLLPVELGTLRALEQGLRFDLRQLPRLALGARRLAEAHQLVERFERFHVGVSLRSGRLLDELLPGGSGNAA